MSAARSSRCSTRLLSRSRDSTSRTVRSGPGRGLLGHQVAQRGVAVLVDGGVEADVLAAPRHQVEDPVDVHAELGGDLRRVGVAAELALEGAAGAADLVELLDHVHGQPHDAGLLRDAAGDRLAHPPGGVGRELVALGVVELLDRADQAGVALLDQVEHRHLGAAVLAGDRDDQAQVGGDERVDGLAALLGEPLELLLGGRTSGRRPSCGRRGPRRGGARPSGRPRSSWRARPRRRRRGGGCGRSRRGRGRRCRGPRSRGSDRCGTCCHGTPSSSCRWTAPLRPHTCCTTSTVTRGFPGQTLDLSPGTTCERPAELPSCENSQGLLRAGPRRPTAPERLGQPHPVEDPGERERPVVPGLVAARDAAVPGRHLGAQQDVRAVRPRSPAAGRPTWRARRRAPGCR